MEGYSSPSFGPQDKAGGDSVEKDYIVLLGQEASTTVRLLSKLGFDTETKNSEDGLRVLLETRQADILVIDAAFSESPERLLQFLRAFDATRELPIVIFSSTNTVPDYSKDFSKVESVSSQNPGLVAGKVATTLRLAKMRGEMARGSSVHEKNLALKTSLREYKREWEEAKVIQASLLAGTKTQCPELDISVLHKPLHDVGGDWYFIEEFSKDRIFISLCDVTGHGLSAAFLGAMTRLALHAGKSEPLPQLMAKANNLLTPELPEGRFITAIGTIINPQTKEIELIRAGHPPALLYRLEEKKVQEIKPNGFALGFMEEALFPSEKLVAKTGDVLIFYSDGITEAADRYKDQFGMKRLKEVLASSATLGSADEICAAIKSALDAHLDGRKMNDDLTIIVIRMR